MLTMLTMLALLAPPALALLAPPALAASPADCEAGGRTRSIVAASPWREGTLQVESCLRDPASHAAGDWQRLVFLRNGPGGGLEWARPLGVQDDAGEVWWTDLQIEARDLDGDGREEVVVLGQLSNCGGSGCVAGTAALYVWPGLPDVGGDCGRRGFEEGQRGRLLLWENARYDVAGWDGPSWVRTEVVRTAPEQLLVRETWTALLPATHDPLVWEQKVAIGASGVLAHCPTTAAPGM